MALTTYCNEANLDSILSAFGVVVRANDDLDGSNSAGADFTAQESAIADCITQATVKINHKLIQRYGVQTLVGSSWVKWACAYLAARALCIRRNNPPPDSVVTECDEIERELAGIYRNEAHLITDSGLPATPRIAGRMTVTNYTVDSRYARGKVRRVPTTSTGGSQGPGLIQQNMREYVWWN